MLTRLTLVLALVLIGCSGEPAPEPTPPDPLDDAWRAAHAGDHEQAIGAYQAITTATPERAEAWTGLAREQLRTEHAAEAAEAATRATELAPESADAHELLGLAELAHEQPGPAAEALARALELDPDRARVLFPLARAQEAAGQREEAIATYRRAAEAGVLPARALAAAARVSIDRLGIRPGDDTLGAIETELDRAEEAAGDDTEARRAIIGQRRRLERLRERPDPAGLLGALTIDSARLDALLGAGQIGSMGSLGSGGLGDSGLGGSRIGTDYGLGGLGLSGTGRGGGGTGEGTIGLGNMGMIGHGGGGGSGSGYGRGAGGLRTRGGPSTAPRVTMGPPSVTGSLDAEVVRLVLRRGQSRARFCYESALNREPGLSGSLTLVLAVSADGAVTSSSVDGSTFSGNEVSDCVARGGRTLRFPASGGGPVSVRVGYTFAPAAASTGE